MGRILWPNNMKDKLEMDLKRLTRKAIRLIDQTVLVQDVIAKVKMKLRKLKK